MAHLRHGKLAMAVLALVLFIAQDAAADPITFANVRGGNPGPSVDLFSNPGITFTTNNPNFIFSILTRGNLPPGATDTLRVTLTGVGEAGPILLVQDLPLPNPNFPGDPINDVVRFAEFVVPLSYQGTSFSLTVDILGSSADFVIPSGPNAGQVVNSYTYTFNVMQPVPEPATVMLLGAGLAGLVARTRRRRSR
jgi:hypothetical protein